MEEKLRYIYKFFSAKHEYNFKAVENGEVYLSDYRKFNDPLEFMMDIEDYEGAEQAALDYIKKKKLITEKGGSNTLSKDEYHTLTYQLSRYKLNSMGGNDFYKIMDTKSKEFNKKIRKVKNSFLKKVNKRIRDEIRHHRALCCFTDLDRLDNYKMWDSYADKHKGFCVQYKIDESNAQFELNKVSYSSNLIKVKKGSLIKYYKKLDDEDIIKNVKKSICRKNMCWRDEKEYRIISSHTGLVKFYPIANVICGLEMKEKDIARMNEICEKINIGCYCIYKKDMSSLTIESYYQMLYDKTLDRMRQEINKRKFDFSKKDEIEEKLKFYKERIKACPFDLWEDLKYFYES